MRCSIAALMALTAWQVRGSLADRPTFAAVCPAAPPRVVRWHHGDAAIRLLPADRGFCYLSGISGHFAGGGEAVRVWVDDGSWYIGGRSCQPGLWGEATCIEWPVAGPAAPRDEPVRR